MPAYATPDAPDSGLIAIALKAQNGQALTDAELARLAARRWEEQQAASPASMMRPSGVAPDAGSVLPTGQIRSMDGGTYWAGGRDAGFFPLSGTAAQGGPRPDRSATPVPSPAAPADYSVGGVLAWLKGSRLDPARAEMERRMAEQTITAGDLQQRQIAAQLDQTATEGRALQMANQPNAALAQQIMSGRDFQSLDPNAAPDRSQLYLGAGGRDPRMAQALMKEGLGPLKPQSYEDPVSGKRFVTYGNQMQPAGMNPEKMGKVDGVEQVKIGGRSYFFHAKSKRYFDENGEPVVFPSSATDAAGAKMLSGSSEADGGVVADGAQLSAEDQQALVWAQANPKDPRSAKILLKLGIVQ